MKTHSNCRPHRINNSVNLGFCHRMLMVQRAKRNKFAGVTRCDKDTISNFLFLAVSRLRFFANDEFARDFISPPRGGSTLCMRGGTQYLSSRALMAFMSIPELLRPRVLCPPADGASAAPAEAWGTRWIWVGCGRMATDFVMMLDRDADKGCPCSSSGSSSSSSCVRRS